MKTAMGATRIDGALARLGEVQAEGPPEDSRRLSIKAAVFGDPVPPRRIGRFVDLSLLGHGAMGTVRRAYDERLAREVAIKLVRHGSVPGHSGRMLREAQALAQLSHPHVVQIYEVGQLEGEMFIAMELVHGETLHQWQGERRSWRECVRAYVQAGRGLAAAHAVGLVHRDFKPSNCIRDEKGRVRVLDFGLARAVDPALRPSGSSEEDIPLASAPSTEIECSKPPTEASGTVLQQRFTEDKAVVGTIAYMAPEQYAGWVVNAKSDQFSFCVALYEALYGELPFSKDPRAALVAMYGGKAVSVGFPAARQVPRAVRSVLRRGLAGDPKARWGSMEALLQALERPLRGARFGLPSLLLVGVFASGLTVMASAVDDDERCLMEDHSLDDVAGPDQRRGFRAAFAAKGAAYARTLQTVELELDHHMEEWQEVSLGLCRAPLGAERKAAAQRCLDQRREALERTVERLDQDDGVTIEHAAHLMARLEPSESCARADASGLGSSDREGSRRVRDLLDEGERLMWADELDEARVRFQEARDEANEQHQGAVAVEASMYLSHLDGTERGRTEFALGRLDGVRAVPGVSDWVRAQIEVTRGHVGYTRGDYAQAENYYRAALEILIRTYGEGHLLLVKPLDGLAAIRSAQGDRQGAARHLQHAERILLSKLGDEHPDTIRQLARLDSHRAVSLVEQEGCARARALLEGAASALEGAGLSGHSDYAEVETNLGVCLKRAGDYSGAESAYRAAIRIWEEVQGEAHPLTLGARLNLARVLGSSGQHDRAIAEYESILAVRGEVTNKTLELAAQAWRDLGRLYWSLEELDEADRNFEQGIELLEGNETTDTAMLASLLAWRGKVAMKRDDGVVAENHYRAALNIHEAAPHVDHAKVARTRYYLGRALAAQRKWQHADEQVGQALNTYEGLGERADSNHVDEAQALRREITKHL